MNKDFRVSVDFFVHHKAKKLRKRLGVGAIVSLLQLWAYAAKVRTDGDLSGMGSEDVELAAEWDGQDGDFTQTLLDIGFLDQVEGRLVLHDWEENNSWVAEEKSRRDRAQKGAQARWNKEKLDNPSKEQTMLEQCSSNAQAMLPHQFSNAPSPSPSPEIHKDKETPLYPLSGELSPTEKNQSLPKPKKQSRKIAVEYSASFLDFWEAYPIRVGKDKAYQAWQKIKQRHPQAKAMEIIEAIKAQVEAGHFQGLDGQNYIPNPATWLNQARWTDEIKLASQFKTRDELAAEKVWADFDRRTA